jgi:gas vesicle protein
MASNRWQETMLAFIVGVGLGTLAGILFAPKSGEETREQIADAMKDGYDSAVAGGRQLARRANQTIDDLKERAGDVVDAGQKAFQQARSSLS